VSTALKIEFPAELPITQHAAEIGALLTAHQVIVVAGETGSGKTTQLPKICLAAGFGVDRMIAHTQPRRLAARAVATRIAEELSVTVGEEVGYAVRFTDKVARNTRIKLLTDGLLLAEIRRDRELRKYDVVIVDEAHERSLNVDFLLGYLKQLMRRRRDLKVIITSATIDVAAFASHFDDAPIVEVSGRSYPVEINYLEHDSDLVVDPEAVLLECLEDICTGPQLSARDVLVFQSGEREIMRTARSLRQAVSEQFEILPLYARLSAADQQRVFKPGKKRRIVLATNVAETSLTVPNIGYVIDPGVARISRYSYRSKLQRLPIEAISQASANQRAGRCGRIAPGRCYRLYTQADFENRPAYTDPEIKRTNLASVVLQMKAFGLGEPLKFPFLEPPDPRVVRDAEKLLMELGALEGERLTDVGRTMARLPVDPRLARMLIAADQTRALTEVLIIVSALAIQDPRERPVEKQGSADRAHRGWEDRRSDFLAFLNLWQWFERSRQELSRAELRKELGRKYLSQPRMWEWRELHRQLLVVARNLNMRLNTEPAAYASIHRALLGGSLSHFGLHEEKGNYLGPRNLKFRIFPGSTLADRPPKWLIASEIAETSRIYARNVAYVEPRWIEEAAEHLIKKSHNEPYWSVRRGETLAYETVTLFGLTLAERRPVSYSRVDPALSRELFLLDGLVRGAIKQPPDFLEHNLLEMAKVQALEDKGRRRDLLLTEPEIAALYAARIPQDVLTARTLAAWWRKADSASRERLVFSADQLSRDPSATYSEEEFPAELQLRDATFALKYRFAPGAADDGVSIQATVGTLGALVAEALEWSVPGMFAGVCEQWLRSLPKNKRRILAPVPDSVSQILPVLLSPRRYRQGRLPVALADVLRNEFRVDINGADWDRERIDPHWLVNVQVLNEQGRVIDQARDVHELQNRFARLLEQRMGGGLRERHEEPGLVEFPRAPIPASVVLGDGGREVVAYPALVDEGETVALRQLLSVSEQAQENRKGYPRLALLQLAAATRHLIKQLNRDPELALLYAPLGNADVLKDELLRMSAWNCFFEGRPLPENADDFTQRIASHKGNLMACFDELRNQLKRVLELRLTLLREARSADSPAFARSVEDIERQLLALVPATVLSETPPDILSELPRYLEAARYRLRNLQGKVQRDQDLMAIIDEFSGRLERLRETSASIGDWQNLRFMLEELRVAIFAEPLGTRGKASPKRLDRAMQARERELGLI